MQHQCQKHDVHHEEWKQSCQGEDCVERQQQRAFDRKDDTSDNDLEVSWIYLASLAYQSGHMMQIFLSIHRYSSGIGTTSVIPETERIFK